jgi:hypothetical protein
VKIGARQMSARRTYGTMSGTRPANTMPGCGETAGGGPPQTSRRQGPATVSFQFRQHLPGQELRASRFG